MSLPGLTGRDKIAKCAKKKTDRKNKLRIPFSSAIKIPQTRRTNDDESNDDVYEEAQRNRGTIIDFGIVIKTNKGSEVSFHSSIATEDLRILTTFLIQYNTV